MLTVFGLGIAYFLAAIPTGVAMHLNPWTAALCAWTGYTAIAAAMLAVGTPARKWLTEKFHISARPDPKKFLWRVWMRWGLPGLALIAPVTCGPYFAALIALMLGERPRTPPSLDSPRSDSLVHRFCDAGRDRKSFLPARTSSPMKAAKARTQRSHCRTPEQSAIPRRRPFRTLAQAKAFVRQVGICGIFSDANGTMSCLWNVVDLPERRPGERGWGEKVSAIWRWKNELPARYPHEIFYGKTKSGLAVLMSIDYLRDRLLS